MVKKPAGPDFLKKERKAITLMGMSGVGKTHLGVQLGLWGWFHYSCDFLIGTRYLGGQKVDGVALKDAVTPQDLSLLSKFVGKLGDPAKGGLKFPEFKKRQQLYYDAECAALSGIGGALRAAKTNFVNDSTGSLCEIGDDELIARLGEQTLFVYIKASAEEEQEVLKRAREYPKPMYFPPEQLTQWLSAYSNEKKTDIATMDPDDFSRWVFPRLFEARLPKYQHLADMYGVTVPSEKMRGVRSEQQFLAVIAEALDEQGR